MGEDHARAEGAGDRSLAHWREGHERFLTAGLVDAALDFSDDMLVVSEALQLLYPRSTSVADRGSALIDGWGSMHDGTHSALGVARGRVLSTPLRDGEQ